MDIGVRPLWSPMPRVAGPAYPVRCPPGDNLMLHAAIYRAPPGAILVVEAGDVGFAVAGGNVCAVAQRRGIAAFVVERVPSESGASSPVDSECWETDGRGPGFLLPDAPVPPAAAVAASHCLPPVYAPFEPDDHDHEDGDPEQPAANPAPIAFDW